MKCLIVLLSLICLPVFASSKPELIAKILAEESQALDVANSDMFAHLNHESPAYNQLFQEFQKELYQLLLDDFEDKRQDKLEYLSELSLSEVKTIHQQTIDWAAIQGLMADTIQNDIDQSYNDSLKAYLKAAVQEPEFDQRIELVKRFYALESTGQLTTFLDVFKDEFSFLDTSNELEWVNRAIENGISKTDLDLHKHLLYMSRSIPLNRLRSYVDQYTSNSVYQVYYEEFDGWSWSSMAKLAKLSAKFLFKTVMLAFN